MIDIHNHLLYGLDDGPQTMEESLEMCQISFRDGVRTIVATPHTLNCVYENSRSVILAKAQELNAILNEKISNRPSFSLPSPIGAENRQPNSPVTKFLEDPTNPIGLTIVPGADVHFSEKLFSQLYQGKIMTIADGMKFLLLEFPSAGIPYQAEVILFQLLVRGITPIISHPERNLEIIHRPQRYIHMIHMGCYGQLSAESLMGGFGKDVKQAAKRLLGKNLVHFIASDGHSANGRPPVLSPAVRAAAKIVGKEEARRMVTDYPQAIIEGRRPNVPEPKESHPWAKAKRCFIGL